MRIAITREVSPAIGRCELSHLDRRPIDIDLARAQHGAYEACLVELGCEIRRLPAEPELPDAVFVEDTAVVLDELAVVTRPGAVSRRRETRTVAEALARHRELVHAIPRGRLDGGDVLAIDRTLFVGRSDRTDDEGARQLALAVAPYAYRVQGVALSGCLHLKSAVTRVAERTILVQPEWVDPGAFDGLERIEVDPGEPFAANALLVGDAVVYPTAFARTRQRLQERGIHVWCVDVTELAKAEGGITCCSLVFAQAER
jgi:dimethylargininase